MAAWDFQKRLPESERFEIVTINPSIFFGPAIVKGDCASGDILVQFLHN
jgi:uncharacterized protein (DUF433 family)